MVLVHCTSPQCDLSVCLKFEVTSFNTFEVMSLTRFRDAGTDGRNDGQGDYSITPSKLRLGGIISAIKGRKHCEKRRSCLLETISPFLTMFSIAIYL